MQELSVERELQGRGLAALDSGQVNSINEWRSVVTERAPMYCFAAYVPTTNAQKNLFQMGDKYHPCIEGIVYVIAENVGDAAKKVPVATSVTLIGPALSNGER